MQQNHTKVGTHHHMLVLLLLIEENAKGIISLDSLVSEIFLLFYLFSSSSRKYILIDVLFHLFYVESWYLIPVQSDILSRVKNES